MTGPKHTRVKGRASRRAILDAALSLFAERGHRGATFSEIARRVGMTQPGLLHHFPSKEALLLEVVQEHETRIAGDVNAHLGPGRLDLRAAIMALAQQNQPAQVEQLLMHTLTAEAVLSEHPLHEHFVARYRASRADLAAALRAARDAGTVRADVDLDAAAREIIATLDGLRLQWLLDPGQVRLDRALGVYADHVAEALTPYRHAARA